MKNNVYKLIDELVDIVDNSKDINNMKDKLTELEQEKELILKTLAELRESMIDEKYIDMNREMADRNFEINLSKEIKKLEKKLARIVENAEAIGKKLEKTTNNLEEVKKEKETRSIYWNNTKDKLSSINRDFYDEEANNYALLEQEVDKLEKEQNAIAKEAECLNEAIDDLKNEIGTKKTRLSEIKANLKNKKCYFDKDLEAKDINEIENLNNRIGELNKEINEINLKPVFAGESIKKMVELDDIYGALKKTKELSDYINKLIEENKMHDYDKVFTELTEFTEQIKDKNYMINNDDYISNRMEFINNEIIELESRKNFYNSEIDNNISAKMDNLFHTIEKLIKKEKDLTAELLNLQKTNLDFNDNIKDKLEITIKNTETNLSSLKSIINKYRNELNNLFLQNEKYQRIISNIMESISDYQLELVDLSKLSNNEVYNINEIISDNNHLKELKNIMETKKIINNPGKSPLELYDQIEMVLGSLNLSDVKSIPKRNISFERVNSEKRAPRRIIEENSPQKNEITNTETEQNIKLHKVIEIISSDNEIIEEETNLNDNETDFVGIDDIINNDGGSLWN